MGFGQQSRPVARSSCEAGRHGTYRARFVLGTDPEAYVGLARVIELVRGWRASEVFEQDEPVSPYLAKEMAWCASTQLRSYGRCRFRFSYGVMPRCASCPLFDPERAIRDSMGEFPAPGIVIELGPALRAMLRGDPVLPDEEEAVDAEVPDFVPEDWGDRRRRIRSPNPRLCKDREPILESVALGQERH